MYNKILSADLWAFKMNCEKITWKFVSNYGCRKFVFAF